MPDLATVLDQVVADFREMLGGPGRSTTAKDGPGETSTVVDRPRPSLTDQRHELDRLLREELQRQGIVVTGREVARVVGAAVGKGIEWTG